MGANDPLPLPEPSRSGEPLSREERLRKIQLHREAWNRRAKDSFLRYCQHPLLWGEEIPADHHEHICYALSRVESGEIDRLMIFAPPGSAKSSYASHRFPSWFLGRHPRKSIIAASHTASLAQAFGRRVRNTISSPEFRDVFPTVRVADDSAARGDWSLSVDRKSNFEAGGPRPGGAYFAVGFDGAAAGRRADGLLIDDPYRHRQDAESPVISERVYESYKSDMRTRLKKSGWIVIIQTRWNVNDLSGRILPDDWDGQSGWVTSRDGEEWYVLRLAMECDSDDDPLGRKLGETLWPAWWTKEFLRKEKLIQGRRNWDSLFQGRPTTEDGAIIKAAYWNVWPSETPPVCEFVLQSIDGAFEDDQSADYSARTTWGIFDAYEQENSRLMEAYYQGRKDRPRMQRYQAVLLEGWRGKVQFHEFKRNVKDGFAEYKPDRLLIEKKASGHSLIQEMRRAGLPVKPVKADKSKMSRTHAAEPAFEQGCVWRMPFDWAKAIVKECAQFPNGENDDWHDTVMQAINYLRRTYHLQLPEEPVIDDEDDGTPRQKPIYG